MSEPARIQRKREKGWRMPEGAVYVGRPTEWGNPWTVTPALGRRSWLVFDPVRRVYLGEFRTAERAAYWATVAYRRDVDGPFTVLRGKDLACWCPLDRPCHADVLLKLANAASPS